MITANIMNGIGINAQSLIVKQIAVHVAVVMKNEKCVNGGCMNGKDAIKELNSLPTTVYAGFYQLRITHNLRDEIVKLLEKQMKEHETPILTIDDAVSELMDRHYDRLKEQEAVVHPEPSCEIKYITDCCCDLCGVQLIREDNFCRGCGKPIEWSK